MKYSRNQINKAGEILLTSSDKEKVNQVIDRINDWRMLHLPVLEELYYNIVITFKKENVHIHSVSHRLKRFSSIRNKIALNPNMGLGGLQDIGGLRIVVSTMKVLDKAFFILRNNIPDHFELTKDPVNYVAEPKKESGYRSIHFIYKYKSRNHDLDGLKIELQLRTKLQHSWAMAVETAELITKSPLKSGKGEEEWIVFFKIISSLFAFKEKTPILREHFNKGYGTITDIISQLYKLNRDNNFIDKLKALNISNKYSKEENHKNGYYILNMNFVDKSVSIKPFPKDKEKEALDEYSLEEKNVEDKKNAVVLVSVPKFQALQEAYPSYFLDTNKFINNIEIEIGKRFGFIDGKKFRSIFAKIYPDSDEQYVKDEKEFSELVEKYKKTGEK